MSRILIAEDSPVNMELLADLLEINGHEVLQARNGKEAVDVAKQQHPDLILLDMMMPVMDGFQAANLLKGDAGTKDIPIVALTALAMEGDERRALEAGCDAYVSKPIDTRALPVMLDQLLGRQPEDAVPRAALEAMDQELTQGLEAIVGAMELLRRRPNDHAAMKTAQQWAHRLRGAAAALGLDQMATELGAVEGTAKRADTEGRVAPEALADVRARLMKVYAMQAKLRAG